MNRIAEILMGALMVGCVALLVLGIFMAATSKDTPTRCPKGWMPNTGYLQTPGSCVPAAQRVSAR